MAMYKSLGLRNPRPPLAKAARGPSWLLRAAIAPMDWFCCGGMILAFAVYIFGSSNEMPADKTAAQPTNLKINHFLLARTIKRSGKWILSTSALVGAAEASSVSFILSSAFSRGVMYV